MSTPIGDIVPFSWYDGSWKYVTNLGGGDSVVPSLAWYALANPHVLKRAFFPRGMSKNLYNPPMYGASSAPLGTALAIFSGCIGVHTL